jgi:hypothetical protein
MLGVMVEHLLHSAAITDARRAISYQSLTRQPYDVATGGYPSVKDERSIRGIVLAYSQTEINGEADIKPTDRRVRLSQADWTECGFEVDRPQADDALTLDGQEYAVIAIMPDPSGASWLLHVRRSG